MPRRPYRRAMNPDDKTRAAAGENDGIPPRTNLTEQESLRKDMSYSPASDTETERKQEEPIPASLDDDIDESKITLVPGTGGPDDVGDVAVDPDELNMPGRDA